VDAWLDFVSKEAPLHVASAESETLKSIVAQDASVGTIVVGASSFALAAVEGVCVFLIALGKLGILVGLASFFSSLIASHYHAPSVRIPALTVALVGATVNVFALLNWRRLRNAPAAAWRRRTLSLRQRLRVGFLAAMSVATILLAVTEFVIHAMEHT
jgi:hypothetical protein